MISRLHPASRGGLDRRHTPARPPTELYWHGRSGGGVGPGQGITKLKGWFTLLFTLAGLAVIGWLIVFLAGDLARFFVPPDPDGNPNAVTPLQRPPSGFLNHARTASLAPGQAHTPARPPMGFYMEARGGAGWQGRPAKPNRGGE